MWKMFFKRFSPSVPLSIHDSFINSFNFLIIVLVCIIFYRYVKLFALILIKAWFFRLYTNASKKKFLFIFYFFFPSFFLHPRIISWVVMRKKIWPKEFSTFQLRLTSILCSLRNKSSLLCGLRAFLRNTS